MNKGTKTRRTTYLGNGQKETVKVATGVWLLGTRDAGPFDHSKKAGSEPGENNF